MADEKPTSPKTTADCLRNLMAEALQTSLIAHAWGMKNRCKNSAKAIRIMELTQNVLTECAKIIKDSGE